MVDLPPLHRRLSTPSADFAALLREVTELVPETAGDEISFCLDEISQEPTLTAGALVEWLTTDEHIDLADELLRRVDVRYLAHRTAVPYSLHPYDPQKAVLAGCRLCARNATPAVSLGWVVGLFDLGLKDPLARDAAEALLRHHVEELPVSTRAILSKLGSFPAHQQPLAEAQTRLDADEKMLEDVQRLPELAMSREERLSLANYRRESQREIHRDARKKSVMLAFATQHHFKYSHDTIIEMSFGGRTVEQRMSLQAHGVTMELPLSEQLNPLSGGLRRSRLWNGLP